MSISKYDPLISIITVTKNSCNIIENAITSVISQNPNLFEYIIIDGSSNDGTQDIIKKYDSRISYWISEADTGIYEAMIKGIQKSQGKWIYFLGSDDILCPGILDKVNNYLLQDNTVYYGNVIRGAQKKPYDGIFNKYKLVGRNICQQSIFYPRIAFKTYSFNLKYRLWADYFLNIQLFNDKNFNFQYIPLIIAKYGTEGSSSAKEDLIFMDDQKEIFRKYFSPLAYYYRRYLTFKLSFIKYINK
jgi:glycosyltransferase involved in cell wall biosynthesis